MRDDHIRDAAHWAGLIREAAFSANQALEPDVIDELALHAEAAFHAAIVRGRAADEAASDVAALIATWVRTGTDLTRPTHRPAAALPPAASGSRLRGVGNDIRYALRVMRRQRAFFAVAILTMALAIGVTTTLFSLVYGVLIRPLPWAEPDRLVRLTESHVGATRQMPLTVTNAFYRAWQDAPETIEGLAGWARTSTTLTGSGEAMRVPTTSVTPSVFPLMRARPIAGAVFTRDDAAEVVISEGFWRERFGGEAAAIGRILELNGQSFTIVGVMPREFVFPDRETRVWRPMAVPAPVAPNGNTMISMFSAIARLKPGSTPAQAAAEATARTRAAEGGGRAALAVFGTNGAAEITATPALEAVTADVKPGLLALLVAVVLLLLTAVANIASLQLARASTRIREMAVRSAIGAGTSRLVQQLLVENVVLSAIGGALGLAMSAGLHRVLPSVLPADFPRLDSIALDSTVVTIALAATSLTGVALGLLPAMQLRRLQLVAALTENSNSAVGAARPRARTLIMTGQVAAACALLAGGILLMRSFTAMAAHDRGFDPSNVLTARLNLPDFAFTPEARAAALDDFMSRVGALPGVTVASLTTGLPLANSENLTAFSMPSVRPPAGATVDVHAVRSVVSAGYVRALGLRLIQGRDFAASDDAVSAKRVVIVNRTFAAQYLTDTPVGNRIRNFMRADGVDFEVIGVVEDSIRKGLADLVQPEIYSLLHQSPRPAPVHDVVVRTAGDPSALTQPLRAVVKQLSASATLDSVRTMEDRIAGSLARPRLYAVLLLAFAVSALAIASVGLFGVVSYTVAQRTRELALRTALGAERRQIALLVFRYALAVTLTGLVVGFGVTLAFGRYLSTLLYGVSYYDAATFGVVALIVSGISLAACVVPAVRASRIDPIVALRA
jgi:putative ABC transport system permease protein